MMSNISIPEFLKIVNHSSILDIRNIENYNNNHIPGARNIPITDLVQNPSKYLNKEEIYYIYCQKGLRTPGICRMLAKSGYHVVNILGGYESWLLEQ